MLSSHFFFQWRSFLIRVIVPTILTIILFVSGIFFFVIPTVEKNSLDRKQEMIRELTNSAWNILAKLDNDEKNGLMTRKEAQIQAIDQFRSLHYGQQMKDYFWINDMHPRMIIHPYRTDLNGKDLTDYVDPDGKHVFMEIINTVNTQGAGFVRYKWQSNEKKDIVVPKISYVKGFIPWGWVIGTGIYIEDVESEINAIIRNIVFVSGVISLVIFLLLFTIIRSSYVTLKKKKETEDKLDSTQSQLAFAGKMASLGKLSAMVAHEINNPLSGILSYSRLSLRYFDQDTLKEEFINSLKENLSLIAGEAKRCGDIVKNLLLFAKQSFNEVKIVHLNEVIDLSVKVIDHSANMKNIGLVTELDSGDDQIECDAGGIQQILVALIMNAIDSSSKGSRIIIRSDYHDNDNINFKVIDFGYGIAGNILPNIFEPFFTTKDSNKSLGLGLSAVYGIVQKHSGVIIVDSKPDKGAVFSITLPRKQKSQDADT